jgi:hypothetical protein
VVMGSQFAGSGGTSSARVNDNGFLTPLSRRAVP